MSVESAAAALKGAINVARAVGNEKAREIAIDQAFAAMDRLVDEINVAESHHDLWHPYGSNH